MVQEEVALCNALLLSTESAPPSGGEVTVLTSTVPPDSPSLLHHPAEVEICRRSVSCRTYAHPEPPPKPSAPSPLLFLFLFLFIVLQHQGRGPRASHVPGKAPLSCSPSPSPLLILFTGWVTAGQPGSHRSQNGRRKQPWLSHPWEECHS